LANAVGKANKTGLLCCPHTGVALAVLEKLVERGDIKKSDRVVVISTANGLKFTDFLFNYHTNQIEGIQSDHAFSPVELAADYEAVRKAILEKIES